MFCLNCGKQIGDTVKFCPHCGAKTTAGQTEETPQTPAGDKETLGAAGKNKSAATPFASMGKRPLWTILIAVVAVVLIAVVVVALVLLNSPKGKVAKAFGKTADAYTEAAEKIAATDVAKLLEEGKYSQSLGLELEDGGDYLSALEGVGLRASVNANLPDHAVSSEATVFYGSADLVTAAVIVDDNKVYINSPEFTGDTYYGLDTTTVGSDLDKLGVDMDDYDTLSFNLFDMSEKLESLIMQYLPDDETQKALESAGKELVDAIVVEKVAKETISVNGVSTECMAYSVLMPQDAMETYLAQVEDALDARDAQEQVELAVEEILNSLGLPEDMVEELMDSLDVSAVDDYDDLFEGLETAVDTLGDVELQVYLKGGYVMAVTYSERVEGTDVELAVYLGGGKNYVDDLSIEISVDDEIEIVLTSSGDHAAKSGVFTDETVLEVTDYWDTLEFVVETSYDLKAEKDNFSCSVDLANEVLVTLEGTIHAEKKYLDVIFDEIFVEVDGEEVGSVSLTYSVGDYEKIPTVKDPVMIADLGKSDLEDIGEEIMDNAYDWIETVMDEAPDVFWGAIAEG